MQLIPEEEIKRQESINFAPMVDFLFLILAVFATIAITRFALYDSEINLVKLKTETDASADPAFNQTYVVNISVTEEGKYKLLTDVSEILLDGSRGIQRESRTSTPKTNPCISIGHLLKVFDTCSS